MSDGCKAAPSAQRGATRDLSSKWTGIVSFYWLHYPLDFKQHAVIQLCKQNAGVQIDRAYEICGNNDFY